MFTKILAVALLTAAAHADTQTDQCHVHTSEGVHFNLSGLKGKAFSGEAISTGTDRTVNWSYCDDNPSFSV